MKKISILFILSILIFGTQASAETMSYDGINYNTDGVIESLNFEEADVFVVPSVIEGTPIKEIGNNAFSYTKLGTVYIDEGIEVIGENAFIGCEVYYIDIPSTVKTVKAGAFDSCTELDTMVINSPDIDFEYDALKNTNRLYVTIPCTMDENYIFGEIYEAKGDTGFDIMRMHEALVESMYEKDVLGSPMYYCEACGYKGSENFDDIYIPFTDVDASAWYHPYVAIAYSFDVLSGKSSDLFCPDDNMTLAETAKIAACIHRAMRDDYTPITQLDGEPWYMAYVRYCKENKILDGNVSFDWEKNATRAEVAYFFSRCSDFDEYIPNPDVPLTDIPDVNEKTLFANYILDLYRKGIATGADEFYTFYPDFYVRRSEAATMIAKILRADLRKELPKG